MTVFLTILSGTLVYVLGQIFLKLFLEPAVELRKVIANVSTALTEYANLYGNAGSTHEFLVTPSVDASKTVRRLAAQLQAQAYTVVGYRLVGWIFDLPPRADVLQAVHRLISLSNSFPGFSAIDPGQAFLNIQTENEIEQLLRIYNAASTLVSAHDEMNSKIRHMFMRQRVVKPPTSFRADDVPPGNPTEPTASEAQHHVDPRH